MHFLSNSLRELVFQGTGVKRYGVLFSYKNEDLVHFRPIPFHFTKYSFINKKAIMGTIPESTSFKISDFIFRFRENSQRFVVEILTQNFAFNLSGTLFFIGLGCSLKWWYKDQLLITLINQNLPSFSKPQQKISWETGEYLIGEQTRQYLRQNKMVTLSPSIHRGCITTQGVKQTEYEKSNKKFSDCASPYISHLQQVDMKRGVGLKNSEMDIFLTPQVRNLSPCSCSDLIDRVNVYSNSVVINFRSPWQKHAYHRFVGLFPELPFSDTAQTSSMQVRRLPSNSGFSDCNQIYSDSASSYISFAPSVTTHLGFASHVEVEQVHMKKEAQSEHIFSAPNSVGEFEKATSSSSTKFVPSLLKKKKYTFLCIFSTPPPKNWFKLSARGLCLLNDASSLSTSSVSASHQPLGAQSCTLIPKVYEGAKMSHYFGTQHESTFRLSIFDAITTFLRKPLRQTLEFPFNAVCEIPLVSGIKSPNRRFNGKPKLVKVVGEKEDALAEHDFQPLVLNKMSPSQLASSVHDRSRTLLSIEKVKPSVKKTGLFFTLEANPIHTRRTGTELVNSRILNKGLAELSVIVNYPTINKENTSPISSKVDRAGAESYMVPSPSRHLYTFTPRCKEAPGQCEKLSPYVQQVQKRLARQTTNFSYPLELTPTMNCWQPPVQKLILNSYLDEIPYKLEKTLWATTRQIDNCRLPLSNKNDLLGQCNGDKKKKDQTLIKSKKKLDKGCRVDEMGLLINEKLDLSSCSEPKTPNQECKESAPEDNTNEMQMKCPGVQKQMHSRGRFDQLTEIKHLLIDELQILANSLPVIFVDRSSRSELKNQANNLKSHLRDSKKKGSWLTPNSNSLDDWCTFDAEQTGSLDSTALLDTLPVSCGHIRNTLQSHSLCELERRCTEKENAHLDSKKSPCFSLLKSLGITFNNLSYLKDPPVLLPMNQDASFWQWNRGKVGMSSSFLSLLGQYNQIGRFSLRTFRKISAICKERKPYTYQKDSLRFFQIGDLTKFGLTSLARQDKSNIVTDTIFRFDQNTMTWQVLQQLNCGESFQNSQTSHDYTSTVGAEKRLQNNREDKKPLVQKNNRSTKRVRFINKIILKQKKSSFFIPSLGADSSSAGAESYMVRSLSIDRGYIYTPGVKQIVDTPRCKSAPGQCERISPYVPVSASHQPVDAQSWSELEIKDRSGGGELRKIENINPVDTQVSLTNKRVRLMSGYVYPDTPSASLIPNFYRWTYSTFPFGGICKTYHTAKTEVFSPITLDRSTAKQVGVNSKEIFAHLEGRKTRAILFEANKGVASSQLVKKANLLSIDGDKNLTPVIQNCLLDSKKFREINRLVDNACLFKVCTSGTPTTIGFLSGVDLDTFAGSESYMVPSLLPLCIVDAPCTTFAPQVHCVKQIVDTPKCKSALGQCERISSSVQQVHNIPRYTIFSIPNSLFNSACNKISFRTEKIMHQNMKESAPPKQIKWESSALTEKAISHPPVPIHSFPLSFQLLSNSQSELNCTHNKVQALSLIDYADSNRTMSFAQNNLASNSCLKNESELKTTPCTFDYTFAQANDSECAENRVEQWNFDHHLGFFPGFLKPNQFIFSLNQIAQGNTLSEDLLTHFYDMSLNSNTYTSSEKRRRYFEPSVHLINSVKGLNETTQNKKGASFHPFDCSSRKTAYNGIVVQRNPFTKDFQLSKKRPGAHSYDKISILGTFLYGPENPFTDRQSHFFGQRRLSTIDVTVFQRDYLRQLGRETLLQSNPKEFTYGASVERVKILSFSKAINSFLSKKRRYTYLLEEKDQWHLLFQEQLRTALEDTRKYPPLTPEESKDHSSGRIKVSAPLMMARFPKKSNCHKVLAHYNELLDNGVSHRYRNLELPIDIQQSLHASPYVVPSPSIHLDTFARAEKMPLHYVKPIVDTPRCKSAPGQCESSLYMVHGASTQPLCNSVLKDSAPAKVYNAIFTETYSSQHNSALLLDQSLFAFGNNNLAFFLGQQWLTQEPLNTNSWLIISQWSFLVALLFWIEQTFLADIFPALFALEQLLLGTTGMKSDDRTHVTRVSKGEIPKFKDIAGIDGLLGELAELVLFLRGHKKRLWNKRSAFGVLLTGPPGTGKTFLVRALANEAKVPVLILSAGVLTANKTNNSKPSWSIRHAFRRAKQLAPCILFIDEIDALGRSRGNIVTDINEIVASAPGVQNVQATPLSNSTFFEMKNSFQFHLPSAIHRRCIDEKATLANTSLQQQLLSATETQPLQIQGTKSLRELASQGKSISTYNKIDRYSLCADTSWLINTSPFGHKSLTIGSETKIPSIGDKTLSTGSYAHASNQPVQSMQTKGNNKRKFGPLTQLLVSMDGVSSLAGVLIIGATNRPESLDPALTRPGRFERIIRVEKPAEQKRIEILKLYSRNLGTQKQIPWSYLANRTMGLTAADLAVAMNYSSLKAILQGTMHTIETIEYGLDSIARFSSR